MRTLAQLHDAAAKLPASLPHLSLLSASCAHLRAGAFRATALQSEVCVTRGSRSPAALVLHRALADRRCVDPPSCLSFSLVRSERAR